jgi:hypothetical protein
MEAARTSESLVNFYQTTWRYNPEDSHLCTHRRENLRSYHKVLICSVSGLWPQIKVQFKRVITFCLCFILENELLRNSGPTLKFSFVDARFEDHSFSLRRQWLESRIYRPWDYSLHPYIFTSCSKRTALHRRITSFLDVTFPRKLVGRCVPIGWPPRSPDFTFFDFHLWGYVKDRVYVPSLPQFSRNCEAECVIR